MAQNYEEDILVPKERIPIIIGKNGETKKRIEETGNIKLKVDSENNTVTIIAKDPVKGYVAKRVIEAIARGFSPDKAQKLFKDDYSFELLYLRDFGANTKKAQDRLKGRVIGTEGKTKKTIEYLSETKLSIYGKTISIIGKYENVDNARRAVERILSGAKQASAYTFLKEKKWQKKD